MSDSLRPQSAAILVILALTSTSGGPSVAAQFAARVTQVEVYATVTGPDGAPVNGLSREDFTVLEDEVPQTVTTFAAGDFPAAVALAVDRSVSMAGKPLTMARTAGRAFIAGLGPADRAMLVSISGEVEVLAPLSTNKAPLLGALERLDPWSTTALHDALIRSLDLLEGETGRRAIVVLSDGEDRYSRASAADVLDRARRSDVLMYPIAIGRTRPPLFAELAATSGGRSFHLRDPRELTPTLKAIAADLRSQYLLGYEPSRVWPVGDVGVHRRLWPAEDAEWRNIRVTVNRPDVRVRARSGYSTR